MNKISRVIFAGLCGLSILGLCSLQASAHAQTVKPKPPMYSYVADWQVPRANWPDVEKATAPVTAVLQKALSDGTLVGCGSDINLVHQPELETHDLWWSSMSMAGLVKTLDQIHAASDPATPVLNNSKHWDEVYVSRFYNWKSGSYQHAYTHVAFYKFKDDAPDDALETLSSQMVAPLLEKLLADGTILEYEIDTQAIHTEDPNGFAIVYITPTPEGIDTVQAAVRDAIRNQPLYGQAFGSETVDSAHRDELLESQGAYK